MILERQKLAKFIEGLSKGDKIDFKQHELRNDVKA